MYYTLATNSCFVAIASVVTARLALNGNLQLGLQTPVKAVGNEFIKIILGSVFGEISNICVCVF